MSSNNSLTIVILSSSDILFNKVQEIFDALKQYKNEFTPLEIQRLTPEQSLGGAKRGPLTEAILMIADVKHFPTLVPHLQRHGLQVPLIPFLRKCTPQNIDEVYRWDYLHMRGVILEKSLLDPEDLGMVARLVKNEVRHGLSLKDIRLPYKELGWKIQTSPKDYEERRFVSLFLDETMRDFMEQLTYVVQANKELLTIPPWSSEQMQALHRLFQDLGDAMDSGSQGRKTLGKLEREAEQQGLLTSGPGVVPQGQWPKPILVEGETGTGKSLIAQWLNRQLYAGQEPELITISTVNISEELLESELFGTIKGAFTGAVSRPGRLLLGRGRVVFLDEIGDLPLTLQAKLLRYLDTMTFVPDNWPFIPDIFSPAFVIAATNRDLRAAVEKGRFRADLNHRFHHRLRVPSLRERRRDLRVLIDFILQDPRINSNGTIKRISLDALTWLEEYPFPGNFRELEQILARAVFYALRAGRNEIRKEDLG